MMIGQGRSMVVWQVMVFLNEPLGSPRNVNSIALPASPPAGVTTNGRGRNRHVPGSDKTHSLDKKIP